jgi:hypothetical protein
MIKAPVGWKPRFSVLGALHPLMDARQGASTILTWLVLPAYQIWHSVKQANTRKTLGAKIDVFATFVPVIILTTVIWGTIWTSGLWLAWRLVH